MPNTAYRSLSPAGWRSIRALDYPNSGNNVANYCLLLHNELAGYADYAAKVRYRLIPGVW
jgi:hypothetical protein